MKAPEMLFCITTGMVNETSTIFLLWLSWHHRFGSVTILDITVLFFEGQKSGSFTVLYGST